MSDGRRRFHWFLFIMAVAAVIGCFNIGLTVSALIFLVLAFIALPYGPQNNLTGASRVFKWTASFALFAAAVYAASRGAAL